MTQRASAALVGMAVASCVVASTLAWAQKFAVTVDGVAVDVLVTHDRRPVKGLTTADFRLRDNGVVQRIESVMVRQRVPGRTVVLVFSDGDDTASWLDPLDVLRAAQRSCRPLRDPQAGVPISDWRRFADTRD